MSIRLLVDEDSQAKTLIILLKSAGHDVLTANEAELSAKDDASVLNYAKSDNRILLTRNPADFLALHQAFPDHQGILTIYKDSNYKKI